MPDELNGLGSEWEVNQRLVTSEMQNVRRVFRVWVGGRFVSGAIFEIVQGWPWTVV